jgi:transposase
VERTATAIGKDGCECDKPRSLRTNHRAVDTIGRDQLSRAETVTAAAIERGVQPLVEAREAVADFQAMVRRKSPTELDPWIERAKTSLVAELANDVMKNRAAVSAALSSGGPMAKPKARSASSSWSSTRMYGRGNLDLLQARVAQRDQSPSKARQRHFPLRIMGLIGSLAGRRIGCRWRLDP